MRKLIQVYWSVALRFFIPYGLDGWGRFFKNNFGGESVAFNAQVGSLAMTEWLVQLYGNLHDYFDAFIFFFQQL